MSQASANRRVVITGMGVVCPLGNSPTSMWEAISAGRSGVAPLVSLPPLAGWVVYAGEARDFTGEIDDFGELEKDVKKSIRKALKMMCRESMMAVAAAQQAVVDAGFAETPMEPERSGVVFGSDYMLSPPDELLAGMKACGAAAGQFEYGKWGGAGIKEMSPLWMLSYLPNMPASHIAIFNDLRGPNNSLTMREASGLMAIREAYQTIQRGHADRMIAGATGTRVHSFKTVHALQQEQLASPELEPAEACRPFDAHRTGMVVGEGAGAVVLEELESARSRGAIISAEVVGTGSATVMDPHGRGHREAALAGAARAALKSAGLNSADVGHVSAHAMGTTDGDAEEAAALATVLGAKADVVPVVAAKSYFGNLGAASGVVETVASVLALRNGQLFATLNYLTPDTACPLKVSHHESPCAAGASFLKLSTTPQGQAAALVVRRFD